MNKANNISEASNLFEPHYTISLLYQKNNSVAMRVFISDAKDENEAINEATRLYRWSMDKYTLVQTVVANVNNQRMRQNIN